MAVVVVILHVEFANLRSYELLDTHTRTCIYIYTYTYIHTYIHPYLETYMQTYIYRNT